MHFGGDFADSQLTGNFFVRQAAYNQFQNLPFSGGQLIEMRLQDVEFRLFDTLSAIPVQGLI